MKEPLLELLAVYHPEQDMLSLHQTGIFHFIYHSELVVTLPKVTLHCYTLPLTQGLSLCEEIGCCGRWVLEAGATGGLFTLRCSINKLSQRSCVSSEDELHLPSFLHNTLYLGVLNISKILLHHHANYTTSTIPAKLNTGVASTK